MHCYYFMVFVVCGVICGCVGQDNDDCFQVTRYPGFKRFEDSCFWASPSEEQKSWDEAQNACTSLGGNLAIVARTETVDFLRQNWDIQSGTYWIGLYINESDLITLTDKEKRRQANWKWLDGTMYDHQGSVKWSNGYPGQRETQGCLLRLEWAAFETSAQKKSQFICETKLKGSPIDPPLEDATDKVPSNTQVDCDDEGQWIYSEVNNLCYSLRTESSSLDWNAAKERCKQLNGQLATPFKEVQNKAVLGIISGRELNDDNVWIGLWHETGASGNQTDNLRQGWQWLDGALYDYQAWEKEEPQSGEKYVRIKNGDWLGIPDGSYHHFLCQKAPQPPPPQPPETPPETPPPPSKPVDPVETPMSDEPNVKDPENKNTFEGRGVPSENGKKKGTDILGPVLGAGLGVLFLVALLVAVMIIKRRNTQSGTVKNCWKVCPFSKPEEYYCDIKDNDLDPAKPSAAVYYNDIASQGHPLSRGTVLNESILSDGVQPSGPEYCNDTDNYEKPIGTNLPKASLVPPIYTHLQ